MYKAPKVPNGYNTQPMTHRQTSLSLSLSQHKTVIDEILEEARGCNGYGLMFTSIEKFP